MITRLMLLAAIRCFLPRAFYLFRRDYKRIRIGRGFSLHELLEGARCLAIGHIGNSRA